MEQQIAAKVQYIFRGASPRVQRPVFGPGWSGQCPGPAQGWGHLTETSTGRWAVLVECYRHQLEPLSVVCRVFATTAGFVAVCQPGGVLRWTDRFGRRFEADETGVRPLVEVNV